MNILIGHKTGIGNLVQFIPVINNLIAQGHRIYSGAEIYQAFELDVQEDCLKKYDMIYLPFGYNWKKVSIETIKHPFTPKYGYKYRIFKRHLSLGYKEAYRINTRSSERDQNSFFFSGHIYDLPFYPKRTPQNSKIVLIHYENRPNRCFSFELAQQLYFYFGKSTNLTPVYITKKSTPTLEVLVYTMRKAEYFIGTDTGVSHIADYLGLKSIVYFGPTDSRKSGMLNGKNIQSGLDCSPCYNWGKIKCTNPEKYACLKLTLNQIQNDVNSLWFSQTV